MRRVNMELKNGYKVIYEVVDNEDATRTFYAVNKEGKAEEIFTATIGKYSLVYEKDGQLYGSEKRVPTDKDVCLDAFDKVFAEATAEAATPAPAVEEDIEPAVTEPEVPEVPEVDDPEDPDAVVDPEVEE
jgi:hypothetical protein